MILLCEHPAPCGMRERPININGLACADQGHPWAALDANDLWIRCLGAQHPVESYGQLARCRHLGHTFRLLMAAVQILLPEIGSLTILICKRASILGVIVLDHTVTIEPDVLPEKWADFYITALKNLIVAHARNVRLIVESRKDDRLDAQILARFARIDP